MYVSLDKPFEREKYLNVLINYILNQKEFLIDTNKKLYNKKEFSTRL